MNREPKVGDKIKVTLENDANFRNVTAGRPTYAKVLTNDWNGEREIVLLDNYSFSGYVTVRSNGGQLGDIAPDQWEYVDEIVF